MLEKLGLGTVQFGQAYGISNRLGPVAKSEVAAIVGLARSAGVRVLDTAANYGIAEDVLGSLDTSGFRIVTKTIHLKWGLAALEARARQSARALRADTLLVHMAADLSAADLWPRLQDLKKEGVFRKIGISTYVAEDPARLAERFQPDVIQLPFSLLDQRLLANGSLRRLHNLGVEVHARSLFLQGLLFATKLPAKLQHAAPQLDRVRAVLRNAGITPLAAALNFVLSRPDIALGIVGVTSTTELAEIFASVREPIPQLDWPALALEDEVVLTPSLW